MDTYTRSTLLGLIVIFGLFGHSWAQQQTNSGEIGTRGVSESDSLALVALYESTNGDEWQESSGWLHSRVRHWDGVTVEGDIITELHFNFNSLNGELPSEIGDLADLEVLYMSRNRIENIPPEIGQLTKLRRINLAANDLTEIPPELGDLENLEYLNLENNDIEGNLPPELGNLSSLEWMELRRNDISGPIPPEFGQLDNLEVLRLNRNSLSGELPSELQNLSSITELNLGGNPLEGTLPAWLGNLSTVEFLDISGAPFIEGELPPEIGQLENLEKLFVAATQITGTIPAEWGNLENLKELALIANNLSGQIPEEIGNLPNIEELILFDNDFSGPIPSSLFNLTTLQVIDFSQNNFSGVIPAEIAGLSDLTHLQLSQNELSGNLPAELGDLTGLNILNLDGNKFEGEIPQSLTNLTNLWNNSNFSFNMLTAEDEAVRDFLDEIDSGWEQTQTVPPENIDINEQAALRAETYSTESDMVEVSWDPIPFTGQQGEYIVRYGTDPGNLDYSVTTDDKSASSVFINDTDAGSDYYFAVQTRTEPHRSNPNDLISPLSTIIDENGEAVATPPSAPALSYPADGDDITPTTVSFEWESAEAAQSYHLQVAKDAEFQEMVTDAADITSTTYDVEDLSHESNYFWRVRAVNEDGLEGSWSTTRQFATVMQPPEIPQLVSPEDGTDNHEGSIVLQWEEADRADSYHIQLSDDEDFDELIINEKQLGESGYEAGELDNASTYFWRVKAVNDGGESEWSETFSFTTDEFVSVAKDPDMPEVFALRNNYPNPFNPVTQIRYDLPEQAQVRLSVYNLLGKHVSTLVNESQSAGHHEVSFDASELSSGTYIYRIEAGDFVSSQTMMLVK